MDSDLLDRARKIRLVCSDVDGVLTDGGLGFGAEGHTTKTFHVRDGAGIVFLQRCGIPVAFISGLASAATEARARQLGVVDCHVGVADKGGVLEGLCAKYGLTQDQVAHVGDDVADLSILRRVGLACCPSDAVAEVQERCHWVVPVAGGRGVLRAVAELILRAQDRWAALVTEAHG